MVDQDIQKDVKTNAPKHGLPLNFDKYSDSHDDPVEGPRYDEPVPNPTGGENRGFVPGQTDDKLARNVEKG